MPQRTLCLLFCATVMLLAASVAAAQADIAALRSRTSFAAAEEGQIAEAIKGDIDKLIAGQSDDVVAAARDSLIKRAEDAAATAEYRAAVAKVTVLEIASRLNNAVVHRNRLSVAIVVARMQNVQSLEVLLKLLGEGKDGEFYPSVRYWAAKGLAGAPLIEAIRTGAGTAMPQRTVLTWLQEAVTRETSPVVAAELFAVLAAIQTEAATDILVPAVAAKARQFDLSQPTAAEAMKSAVALLQKAFELERREAAAGKQPIVASLVQIMVQTPPKDAGLELAETLDATLATLTGQKTALAAAIKEFRDQASTGLRPQQVDAIWLQQLNWMETLLKTANKDVRLLSRPQVLAWKSELSAGVVTAIQKGK